MSGGRISRFFGRVWSFIIALVLIASLGLNFYFVWKQGIHINHHYHQEQIQQQAQLILMPFQGSGHVVWTKEQPENLLNRLNALPPEQSMFAVVQGKDLYYPVLVGESMSQQQQFPEVEREEPAVEGESLEVESG